METGIKKDPVRKKAGYELLGRHYCNGVLFSYDAQIMLHLVRNIWPRAKHLHVIVNKRKLTQWLESSCTHTHRCADKSGVCVC